MFSCSPQKWKRKAKLSFKTTSLLLRTSKSLVHLKSTGKKKSVKEMKAFNIKHPKETLSVYDVEEPCSKDAEFMLDL